MMENDEIRLKRRRTIEDLKTLRSTGTSSWYAPNDNPSIVKSPSPPPTKRANCAAPNQRQIQFKSTNLVSRGGVVTEPSRPRIQRFAWQLILALDVNDLGDFALFVKPTRWTLVFTFLSHCWGRCLRLTVMKQKYAATERTLIYSDFRQTKDWLGLWNAQECDHIRI